MTTHNSLPVAVVTGGAGALGSAIATYFSRRGERVIILDLNGEEAARRAAQIGEVTTNPLVSMQVDLSDPIQAQECIQKISSDFGRLDRLINNAAFNPKQSLASTDLDAWDKTMAINLRAPMSLVQAAIPIWQTTRYGQVVNISSRTYLSGGPAAYTTSKAGLIGLTRSMALELGRLGVTANAVAPSMVKTPFTQQGRTEAEFKAFIEKHTAMSALKRLANIDDVVNAVGFLASDQATFITGEVLHVAGGAQLAAAP